MRVPGRCSTGLSEPRSTSTSDAPATNAGPPFAGFRNGYARPREVGIGTWSVAVRAPRVSDSPPEAPAFASAILPKRRYLSQDTQRLFARLYLEGLSSGDFEPAFRELLGERAPLSASTIVRLKDEWAADYARWRSRHDLDARVAQIADQGIEPSKWEPYPNGMRKAIYHDPDGNEFGFGGAPPVTDG